MKFEESNNTGVEKELSEEEVLNSNDVELIVEYAKENRSKIAIDKVRELLELARKTGEEVVQNFLNSFVECEEEKIDYLNFENTEGGKLALSLLETLPEPFKTTAYKKLEDYKKELEFNTELFEKHKNNPEEIWKEIFGFDYHDAPEFKERFKTFLFKSVGARSKDYYKQHALEAKQNPFSVNFFVEDPEKFNAAFNKINEKNTENVHKTYAAFSGDQDSIKINTIQANLPLEEIENIINHESEHAIHKSANVIDAHILEPGRAQDNLGFKFNREELNRGMRFDFEERLKQAKDEIFAYLKGKTAKEDVEYVLTLKGADAPYDYSKDNRDMDTEAINRNKYLSEVEKQKLKDAINFLQSEYDRVLKNMIDVIYEKNQSVEFFRNVPINELWKYSNGKHNRTDFVIREFKF